MEEETPVGWRVETIMKVMKELYRGKEEGGMWMIGCIVCLTSIHKVASSVNE